MNLRIPGPIPVPEDILETMSNPMINHRGSEFKEILYRSTEGLKTVFGTKSPVYILTVSGTGAMEAAVVNTLSKGDKVLCTSIGTFGDRFGQIAHIYGANLVNLEFSPGTAVDVNQLRNYLSKDPDIKAVLVTHNETSTGVANNLEEISKLVKKEYDNKLLLVDGISSVASLPTYMDLWGCDVIATASQKGWMLPPGLAFLSFSDFALESYQTSDMPKFYFDIGQYEKYFQMGQTPYTPAVSLMFALDLALNQILEEGVENVYLRHKEIGEFTRNEIRKLGLSILPEEKVASNTVTAVNVPDGYQAGELITFMKKNYDVVLAAGQGELKEKIFRIGHMGKTTRNDIKPIIEGLSKYIS